VIRPSQTKELPAAAKQGRSEAAAVVGISFLLVLVVLAVFGQTASYGFVNYDDGANVSQNPVVRKGLSGPVIGWAFTHSQAANWIPLTTLSHMLDCQLFGLRAGGHHLVNVFWHAANAVLLFLVLRRMTGGLWRSALVAALFAVHPLRAESVAWVSERKDVLSGFFFILTIWAYLRYVEEFNPPSQKLRRARVFYGLSLLCFALGLMAKSMVATLPFVLLLLDYWPLRRWHEARQFPGQVREKIPWLVLSAASCVATLLTPDLVIAGDHRLSLVNRIANALVSYVVYLKQMVFPAGLATPYPIRPGGQPWLTVGLAMVVLTAITAAVLSRRKKQPYLLVGWLWYLGMLFPVIGIIQISADASHADRYTYLPEIGLAVSGIWAAADWFARWQRQRIVSGMVAAAMVGSLMVVARTQTSYWRDSESLWSHSLACNSSNYLAHCDLSLALVEKGAKDEALRQCRMALEIKPDYPEALNNLGVLLLDRGEKAEAVALCRKALQFKPDFAEARNNLGNALLAEGEREQAMVEFRKALQIDPGNQKACYNLANAFYELGKNEEAIAQYRQALKLNPNFVEALGNLGAAMFASGNGEEAIALYRQALNIKTNYAEARINLGIALVAKGEFEEGMAQYRQALQIDPNYAKAHYNLANALASQGRNDEAIPHLRKAIEIKPDYAYAHYCLATILYAREQWEEAITDFQRALELKPDFAQASYGLAKTRLRKGDLSRAMSCFAKITPLSSDPAVAWPELGGLLLQKGDLEEAILCYRQTLRINPRSGDSYANLGLACFEKGEVKDAIDAWQLALETQPGQPNVQNNLAWLLATTPDPTLRNGAKAVALAEEANQSNGGGNAMILHTLAAAYAEAGRYGDATATARRALELAAAQKNDDLTTKLHREMKLYEAGTPIRDVPQ
jgi:protein O-mannosyl-transferase